MSSVGEKSNAISRDTSYDIGYFNQPGAQRQGRRASAALSNTEESVPYDPGTGSRIPKSGSKLSVGAMSAAESTGQQESHYGAFLGNNLHNGAPLRPIEDEDFDSSLKPSGAPSGVPSGIPEPKRFAIGASLSLIDLVNKKYVSDDEDEEKRQTQQQNQQQQRSSAATAKQNSKASKEIRKMANLFDRYSGAFGDDILLGDAPLENKEVQTDNTELRSVMKLRAKARGVITNLATLMEKVQLAKKRARSDLKRYVISTINALYTYYSESWAQQDEQFSKRIAEMKDAYAAQLNNLLTRERGDWVLSFKRKYEEDIEAVSKSYEPAIAAASEVIRTLTEKNEENAADLLEISRFVLALEGEKAELEAARDRNEVVVVQNTYGKGGVAGAGGPSAVDGRPVGWGGMGAFTSAGNSLVTGAGAMDAQHYATPLNKQTRKMVAMDLVALGTAVTDSDKRNVEKMAQASLEAPAPSVLDMVTMYGEFVAKREQMLLDEQIDNYRMQLERFAKRLHKVLVKMSASHGTTIEDADRAVQRAAALKNTEIDLSSQDKLLVSVKLARMRAAHAQLSNERMVLSTLMDARSKTKAKIMAERQAAQEKEKEKIFLNGPSKSKSGSGSKDNSQPHSQAISRSLSLEDLHFPDIMIMPSATSAATNAAQVKKRHPLAAMQGFKTGGTLQEPSAPTSRRPDKRTPRKDSHPHDPAVSVVGLGERQTPRRDRADSGTFRDRADSGAFRDRADSGAYRDRADSDLSSTAKERAQLPPSSTTSVSGAAAGGTGASDAPTAHKKGFFKVRGPVNKADKKGGKSRNVSLKGAVSVRPAGQRAHSPRSSGSRASSHSRSLSDFDSDDPDDE